MGKIDGEMARKHAKEDELARAELKKSSLPIEQRIDADYREHISELLQDLQGDYDLQDINSYEDGEYCTILKHKVTGKLKSYGFELPLRANLALVNPADPNNLEIRTSELQQYLTQLISTGESQT